jgi:hypothetical protein
MDGIVVVRQAESMHELEEICSLNLKNMKSNLSKNEQEEDGFVSLEYPLEKLSKMAEMEKPIVAVYNDHVVGYLLATPKSYYGIYEPIDGSFDVMASVVYQGHLMKDYNYLFVGQICIAKEFRGQQNDFNVFQRLYQQYYECYGSKYDFVVADVSAANPRSLKAHLRNGFEIIGSLTIMNSEWKLIVWDWRRGI